jgi:hypothetical protein
METDIQYKAQNRYSSISSMFARETVKAAAADDGAFHAFALPWRRGHPWSS